MKNIDSNRCPWADRVSAHIDGELPADQVGMLKAHLKNCSLCRSLVDHETQFSATHRSAVDDLSPPIALNFPIRATARNRIMLGIAGVFILIGSLPDFGRGNTGGNTLHDLRHLAMWQVAIGVAVVTAAITFRLSRLLTAMLLTFLVLTVVATIYDLVTGHRGPWADPLHVVEVAAVLVVLHLVLPYRNLAASADRPTRLRFGGRYGSPSVPPHSHPGR